MGVTVLVQLTCTMLTNTAIKDPLTKTARNPKLEWKRIDFFDDACGIAQTLTLIYCLSTYVQEKCLLMPLFLLESAHQMCFLRFLREDWGESGAHQMEPPSPLISWVNHFPSRFINRTACFQRKVSYFRESRLSPRKNKVGWSRTQKPVLRPFSSIYYTSIFTILQPLGSGYHEIKVNELPDWDWDGTNSELGMTERLSLRVFVFFFLASYIPHVSKHLERVDD